MYSFAQAYTPLTDFLSTRRDLLENHKEFINKIKFSKEFMQALADKFNKGVQVLQQIM